MNEIYHHGILGMKWGVRRYQNADGSLTAAGKKKYGTKTNFNKVQAAKKAASTSSKAQKARDKANARTAAEIAKYKKKTGKTDESQNGKADSKPKSKSISEMSDDEIRAKIQRIQLENQLKSLTPRELSKGEKFTKFAKDYILPAVKDPLTKYVQKELSNALGLNEKKVESEFEKRAKEAKDLVNQKIIHDTSEYLKNAKAGKQSQNKDGSNNSNNSNQQTQNRDGSSNSNQQSRTSDWGNYNSQQLPPRTKQSTKEEKRQAKEQKEQAQMAKERAKWDKAKEEYERKQSGYYDTNADRMKSEANAKASSASSSYWNGAKEDTKTFTGTVVGEGTSHARYQSKAEKAYSSYYDAEFTDISGSSSTSTALSIVNNLPILKEEKWW